jgi:hypothetical protein
MRTKKRGIKRNIKAEETKKQEGKVKENNNNEERARIRTVWMNIRTLRKAREGERSSR